jgi:hypothetical protein
MFPSGSLSVTSRPTGTSYGSSILMARDLLRIEEFVLERLEGIVVQMKLHFERAIGHTLPLA